MKAEQEENLGLHAILVACLRADVHELFSKVYYDGLLETLQELKEALK